MKTITIEVPDDALAALRRSPEEFADEMRLAAAIQWYGQGLISQGKAAEIAGRDRRSFIRALGRAGVDAIQITAEELGDDVEQDLQARRERLAVDPPDGGGAPGKPLVLTINGKAELVVQDVRTYQRLLDLAERLETIQTVKDGLASMGRGEGWPMDDVFDQLEEEWRDH